MKQLDEIRARLEATTPGPWVAEYSGEQGNCVIPVDAQSTREAVAITRLYHQVADAEFIAHAPTDIARLLAAVEAVEDLIGWLEAASADDEPMYAKGKVSARATADRLRAALAAALGGAE